LAGTPTFDHRGFIPIQKGFKGLAKATTFDHGGGKLKALSAL